VKGFEGWNEGYFEGGRVRDYAPFGNSLVNIREDGGGGIVTNVW